jgi:ArsR family transcriptional regulator, lead/cadmium/zinc/bismuth-responsive transcriptional repressor
VADDHCDLLCLDLPRAEELRRRRLPPEVTEVMATKVRALADSTRLGLVAALSDGGELCVCDLAWISGKAQNLVSHHLRALKGAGLASSRREGKIVFYSLSEEGERLFGLLAGEPALAARPETRR